MSLQFTHRGPDFTYIQCIVLCLLGLRQVLPLSAPMPKSSSSSITGRSSRLKFKRSGLKIQARFNYLSLTCPRVLYTSTCSSSTVRAGNYNTKIRSYF